MAFQVDYFPSRYDPVRHAERFPIPPGVLTGRREKVSISKTFSVHSMFLDTVGNDIGSTSVLGNRKLYLKV